MDRVQVSHVSKRYVLGQRRNAREALVDTARRMFRLRSSPGQEIWSLRDVSFAVADGESLGIIGRNGAGKSTVLKVLTAITTPTRGVSRTRGRVAALLEVGTGFHSELTGRENIFLNGAILGMSRREIARAFDAIVEFSGVEKFLDTPVKHYSSGMHLRLGFAVAAHLEPDVLVVDEILAVGDAEFQRKCLGRMEQAGQEGRSVIFVSHDLESVRALCPRSLWLESGEVRADGSSDDIVRDYLASGLVSPQSGTALVSADSVTVLDVRVQSSHGRHSSVLMRDDAVIIEVDFEVTMDVPGFEFAVNVTTSGGARIFDQMTSDTSQLRLSKGSYRARLEIPPVLNVGTYAVGVWFGTQQTDVVDEPAVRSFTLHGNDRGRPARILVSTFPLTVTPLR